MNFFIVVPHKSSFRKKGLGPQSEGIAHHKEEVLAEEGEMASHTAATVRKLRNNRKGSLTVVRENYLYSVNHVF